MVVKMVGVGAQSLTEVGNLQVFRDEVVERVGAVVQLDEAYRRGVPRICALAKLFVSEACGPTMCVMANFSIRTSMAKPKPLALS